MVFNVLIRSFILSHAYNTYVVMYVHILVLVYFLFITYICRAHGYSEAVLSDGINMLCPDIVEPTMSIKKKESLSSFPFIFHIHLHSTRKF